MDSGTLEVVGAVVGAAGIIGGTTWALRRRRARTGGVSVSAPAEPSTGGARGLAAALTTSGRRLRERLDEALRAGSGDVLGGVEAALLSADVGGQTTRRLLDAVRDHTGAGPDATRDALRTAMLSMLGEGGAVMPSERPWVILVTGINGVGKTTTIGKLAALHRGAGRKVLLVAADTFRAAAIDQLGVWAERTGAGVVRHAQGADPSAVVFDGLRAARARGVDVVIIDTAGRLHTRAPLMDELRKIRRTIDRESPGAPHEVLLVLDATTGQNALSQAKSFLEATGVTGVIVTKLDGTAKGGMVLAVARELGIPVRYVGVGEGATDLREFEPEAFVDALLPRRTDALRPAPPMA